MSFIRTIKKWLRSVQHVPDRMRHSSRRRAAIERLVTGPTWRGQILFVCHGNVCRSPFAEVLFERRVGARGPVPGFRATSAGFVGPDRGSPPDAIAAAARAGLDLRPHRSKLITAQLVRESSLIVVMSAPQANFIRSTYSCNAAKLLVLGDLDPLPIATRTIQDPWKSAAEVFDESYARIDRCISVMVDGASSDVSPVRPTYGKVSVAG